MNLINDAWIPIRGDGVVSPQRIADLLGDPRVAISDIAWPRADFLGATLEFLIGLLQTAFGPETHEEWKHYYLMPPSADPLTRAFAPFLAAFELLGDGWRFMQDREIADLEPASVASLLIDSPGENALKRNTDLFVKRRAEPVMSPAVAAIALYTLQAYAPSGGAGHRTGLRGGGPLTTLLFIDDAVVGQGYTLWRSLWLNVLPVGENRVRGVDPHVFPWMAPTRTSDPKAGGVDIHPGMIRPFAEYWATPRRLWLHTRASTGEPSLVTGESSPVMITGVSTKNYGANYVGGHRHPLSPYRLDKKQGNLPLPLHGKVRLDYRDWLPLALGRNDERQAIEAARVVVAYEAPNDVDTDRRTVANEPYRDAGGDARSVNLMAFGYEMDNMKPRAFSRAVLPVLEHRGAREFDVGILRDQIALMIDVAGWADSVLRGAFKEAMYDGKDTKGDLDWITAELMARTGAAFYDAVSMLQRVFADESYESWDVESKAKREFAAVLQTTALALFDERTGEASSEQGDMKKTVAARLMLKRTLYGKGFWNRLDVTRADLNEDDT